MIELLSSFVERREQAYGCLILAWDASLLSYSALAWGQVTDRTYLSLIYASIAKLWVIWQQYYYLIINVFETNTIPSLCPWRWGDKHLDHRVIHTNQSACRVHDRRVRELAQLLRHWHGVSIYCGRFQVFASMVLNL